MITVTPASRKIPAWLARRHVDLYDSWRNGEEFSRFAKKYGNRNDILDAVSNLRSGAAYLSKDEGIIRFTGNVEVTPEYRSGRVPESVDFEFSSGAYSKPEWLFPHLTRLLIPLNDSPESIRNHEFLDHMQWRRDDRSKNIPHEGAWAIKILRSMKPNISQVRIHGQDTGVYRGVVRYDLAKCDNIPFFMFTTDKKETYWLTPGGILFHRINF